VLASIVVHKLHILDRGDGEPSIPPVPTMPDCRYNSLRHNPRRGPGTRLRTPHSKTSGPRCHPRRPVRPKEGGTAAVQVINYFEVAHMLLRFVAQLFHSLAVVP
jgi:hypothetical protein